MKPKSRTRRKPAKKKKPLITLRTFQMPVALVVIGLTCIGGGVISGSSNAAISKAKAIATLNASRYKVCKIKAAEHEAESGHHIWSFDTQCPGAKKVTEIWVDDRTAKIVKVEGEKPGPESDAAPGPGN